MAVEDTVQYETMESVRGEWAALAEQVDAMPFLRPGWFEAWCDAFGARDLRLLCARRGDTLVGVLPLDTGRRGLCRSPTNMDTPRFGALLRDAAAAEAFARHLTTSGPRRLDIAFVPDGDPLLGRLADLGPPSGSALLTRSIARQPYLDLSIGPEAYEQSLGRKLRSSLRRRRRRLEEQGEVEFTVHDGSRWLHALLREGFAVEASGWKGEAGSAIASTAEHARFYTAVAEWAADRGWLRLAFLRVDGRPVAFSMFLVASRRVWALKLGVDPAFRCAGAGVLLTWESLRHWLGSGLESFEFLGDADPFKLTWTDSTREVLRVQLFSRSLGGALEHRLWRHGSGLVRRVPRVRARRREGAAPPAALRPA
jgi:CelD/BcsL family acetyltransferase involved in cellulose biosynthesis